MAKHEKISRKGKIRDGGVEYLCPPLPYNDTVRNLNCRLLIEKEKKTPNDLLNENSTEKKTTPQEP